MSTLKHDNFLNKVHDLNKNIEVIGIYQKAHTKIEFKCLIDGFCWLATPSSISRGQGCPKCFRNKLHNKFKKPQEQYLEEVDALVFSGDYLVQPENRVKFQEYLDRWKRGLDSMAETFPEGDIESEDDGSDIEEDY